MTGWKENSGVKLAVSGKGGVGKTTLAAFCFVLESCAGKK